MVVCMPASLSRLKFKVPVGTYTTTSSCLAQKMSFMIIWKSASEWLQWGVLFPQKMNKDTTYGLGIPFPKCLWLEVFQICEVFRLGIFAGLYCLSSSKKRSTSTMGYYFEILKRRDYCHTQQYILWRFMLNEMHQSQKGTYCMIALIWVM